MRNFIIVGAMALALTACGKSEEKAAGGEAASGAPAAAVDLTPGEYETKIEVTKFEMAGVPEAMAKQMKDQMAANIPTQKTCVTEANIAQMKEQMVKNAANAPEGCTVDNRSSGNNVDATVTCTAPVAVTSTVKGTMTDMVITSQTDANGQKVNMEMNAKMTRIGDCAA